MFAEIMEWIIKKILSVIFRKQDRRKRELIIDLNKKDGIYRLKYTSEQGGAIASKKDEEQYGINEADRTRQTNKGDNDNAEVDASRNEN